MMRITVLGIGNTLMTDEGFGAAVLAELSDRLGVAPGQGAGIPFPPDAHVQLVEGGVMGMKLLPHLQTSDAVVVVDAAHVGAEAGALFRFTPEEAELEVTRPMSAHEIALPHLLATARLVGAEPEVVIVACQVERVEEGEVLSAAVGAAVPRAADIVLEEIVRFASASARGRADREDVD